MGVTKSDRVFAALRGESASGGDRVPVSAWWHDFAREWSPQGLAAATLEAYRRYDWDYIKVNPRASYYAEDYGARFQSHEHRQPDLLQPGVGSAEDVRRLRPLDATQGAYGEQLEALRLIARELRGEAPFIQTVFSPLAVISRTAGSAKFVQRLMRENPDELLAGLEAVTQTLAAYARACLDAGAAGIFFATVEWGSADNITPGDYDRFARPFDLRVLAAAAGAPFNVFHVCRANNHLLRLLDYPVAAFHWDARAPGNPSLAEALERTERAVMGGVSHEGAMGGNDPALVEAEARAAIAEAGGRRLLLAPGCSIDPAVPEGNLRALAGAARR
ncbi:MAG: uroporphyrinogen decarboxylase family protein [Dehalococcoidia bacterium]|nr:uroporphyrinogen decarboxylase family protein [Dehalococcoidia bacterium]